MDEVPDSANSVECESEACGSDAEAPTAVNTDNVEVTYSKIFVTRLAAKSLSPNTRRSVGYRCLFVENGNEMYWAVSGHFDIACLDVLSGLLKETTSCMRRQTDDYERGAYSALGVVYFSGCLSQSANNPHCIHLDLPPCLISAYPLT